MLSSLAEQTRPELVVVDIAHMTNNGSPETEAVISAFAPKLRLKSSLWTGAEYLQFQKRGLVRNRQLAECATEWLLFADCDMVYHPEYFERLVSELTTKHAAATCMLSTGRTSNPKEAANQLVASVDLTPGFHISDAFARANQLPKIRRGNVGAGFSQIINVRTAPHGGLYVSPENNRDWSWANRHQKAKSDVQFRRRIAKLGGPRVRLAQWYRDGLIHLNHNRDKEFGRHLEEQR